MARVLLAEDNRESRLALRLVLEAEGHEVIEAEEGAAALDLARRVGVDLFVCDVFMPGVDGLQAIREFRANFPRVPVVAVSGGAFGGRLDMLPAAVRLGADRALVKPFEPHQLCDVVRELLDQAGSGAG